MHQCAGFECTEIQRLVVEYSLRFGVGRKQHLKAAVQSESFYLIGTYASANSVRSFDYEKGQA